MKKNIVRVIASLLLCWGFLALCVDIDSPSFLAAAITAASSIPALGIGYFLLKVTGDVR